MLGYTLQHLQVFYFFDFTANRRISNDEEYTFGLIINTIGQAKINN